MSNFSPENRFALKLGLTLFCSTSISLSHLIRKSYEECSLCDVRGPAICKLYHATHLTLLSWQNCIDINSRVVIWYDQKCNVINCAWKKTTDSKAEQSCQSQGLCNLPKGTKHPGSDPPPKAPTWPNVTFVSFCFTLFSYQKHDGWAENLPQSRLRKAVNSELYALFPSDYQNTCESRRRRLELCAKRRGVFWRNVNLWNKSDRCFLFYWHADITKPRITVYIWQLSCHLHKLSVFSYF